MVYQKWFVRRSIFAILLGLIFLFGLEVGKHGLDFGNSWDEGWMFLEPVTKSHQTGLFLPRTYIYPSLGYDITLLSSFFANQKGITDFFSHDFMLSARTVFLTISLLAIVWIALLGKILFGGSNCQGILAAIILAGSWEFVYHARWIAPNNILAAFSVLSILFSIAFIKNGKNKWLLVSSAICGGLAFSAKYPAGLLLIPVLIAGLVTLDENKASLRKFTNYGILNNLFLSTSLFFVTFLLTTPGIFLEPQKAWQDLSMAYEVYKTGFWGYTVESGLCHLSQMSDYFLFAAMSHQPFISAMFGLFSVVGIGHLVINAFLRFSWKKILQLLVVLFPLVYVIYFSSQKVMLIRNLMVIIPFLALFSARGLIVFIQQLGKIPYILPRLMAVGISSIFLGMAISYNVYWQWFSAETIVEFRNVTAFDLTPIVANTKIWVSPSLRTRLTNEKSLNLTAWEEAQLIVIQRTDLKEDGRGMKANQRGSYMLLPVGPFDVNYDYYPTWLGPLRPLIIEKAFFEKTGLTLK